MTNKKAVAKTKNNSNKSCPTTNIQRQFNGVPQHTWISTFIPCCPSTYTLILNCRSPTYTCIRASLLPCDLHTLASSSLISNDVHTMTHLIYSLSTIETFWSLCRMSGLRPRQEFYELLRQRWCLVRKVRAKIRTYLVCGKWSLQKR